MQTRGNAFHSKNLEPRAGGGAMKAGWVLCSTTGANEIGPITGGTSPRFYTRLPPPPPSRSGPKAPRGGGGGGGGIGGGGSGRCNEEGAVGRVGWGGVQVGQFGVVRGGAGVGGGGGGTGSPYPPLPSI